MRRPSRPPLDHWPSRLVIAAATLVPVALIVGVVAISAVKSYYDLTAFTIARRQGLTALAALTLQERLDRLMELSLSLATRVRFGQAIQEGQWDEAVRILQRVPQDFPWVERVLLIDPQGTLRADTPAVPGARGSTVADRAWYEGARRTGAPYLADVDTRPMGPQAPVLAVAIPIPAEAPTLPGFLALQIHPPRLLDWLSTIALGPSGVVYVVDRRGTVVHPTVGPDERRAFADLPAVQRVRRGERGVEIFSHPVAQEARLTAYEPLPRYGWGVVTEQPTQSAFAARDRELRRLLLVYGVVAAASGTLALWLFRTLTAHRRAAAQIHALHAALQQRATALETANRELEAFSAAVSHDLRAPLRGIDGFSQVLLEDYADRLDAQGQAALRRIRAGTQRMAELIDALLALSRVARAELRRERVDLSALTRAIAAELQGQEPTRPVTWVIPEGLSATGDARLLRIVLENLLGNAWKFTGKQPAAQIAFGAFAPPDGPLVFFVRDNGAGFDMAYAARLFGAFQRLHGVAEFPGLGIGLATVQRIIHRHGGRIWAEGAVGQGAIFSFTLGGPDGAATDQDRRPVGTQAHAAASLPSPVVSGYLRHPHP